MNLKKLIIILIICIMIVTSMLLIVLKWNKKENISNQIGIRPISDEEYQEYLQNTEFGKVNKLYDSTTFFTVTSCINKYITYNLQSDSEKLYNVLSQEYIKQNKINKDNILEKIQIYNKGESFTAKTIYEYNNNQTISTYFVYGKLIEDEYISEDVKEKDLYIVVQLDKVNRSFYIILNETHETNSIAKNMELTKIPNNSINVYETPKVVDTQMGIIYFNDYKEKILKDINTSYMLLDEEYKEKRFKTVEEFQKYVLSINGLEYISAIDCKVVEDDEKNIFTIKDQYGNTYVFKETAVMEYTVQLDDYTLENEMFNDKYNEVSDRDKGLLNIDKFFKMINMQDYTSAYKVLDENFKQNYFKTQLDFENYIRTKTFRYNKVNYKEYSNKLTDIYTYKVVLTDMQEENTNEIEFNIIMKILEGTDFVMSFEVK